MNDFEWGMVTGAVSVVVITGLWLWVSLDLYPAWRVWRWRRRFRLSRRNNLTSGPAPKGAGPIGTFRGMADDGSMIIELGMPEGERLTPEYSHYHIKRVGGEARQMKSIWPDNETIAYLNKKDKP